MLFVSALLAALPVAAQVRHVTTVNPLSPSQQGYQEVYEFDYVDVQTREYPYHAYQQRIQGRVLCSFIVGTDGKVSHVRVVRSAGNEALDREAMRVIGEMPKWTVGKVAGKAVPVRCVIPIAFRL